MLIKAFKFNKNGRKNKCNEVHKGTKKGKPESVTPLRKNSSCIGWVKQEDSIAQICRNHRITPATYYKWSKDFMEAGKHRLQVDTLREANTTEVKKLKAENEELTHMFK